MSDISLYDGRAGDRAGIEVNRPWTCHGFPQRSNRHPFFARNNPHVKHVRHIEGLLGAPICHVTNSRPQQRRRQITNPIITDDYLQNLPIKLQSFQVKEKALPSIGIVPVTTGWREALIRLITTLQDDNTADCAGRGRAIISPSKEKSIAKRCARKKMEEEFIRNVTSREQTRPATAPFTNSMEHNQAVLLNNQGAGCGNNLQHDWKGALMIQNTPFDSGHLESLVALPDHETYMFQLLAAILQTDSATVVQQWLVQAPLREKQLVTDILHVMTLTDDNQEDGFSLTPTPQTIYEDQMLQQEMGIDIDEIRRYNRQHRDRNSTCWGKQLNTNQEQPQSPRLSSRQLSKSRLRTSDCKPCTPFCVELPLSQGSRRTVSNVSKMNDRQEGIRLRMVTRDGSSHSRSLWTSRQPGDAKACMSPVWYASKSVPSDHNTQKEQFKSEPCEHPLDVLSENDVNTY